jgi:hypothetical protein
MRRMMHDARAREMWGYALLLAILATGSLVAIHLLNNGISDTMNRLGNDLLKSVGS